MFLMTAGQKRRIMPKIISEQEKNEREEYILAQAIALFDEMDFFDITMNQLAKKCGLSKGTLFNHFPTKETIFARLLYKEYASWGIYELQQLREQKHFTPESYLDFIMKMTKDVLENRMRMIRLVSLKRSIINQNIAPEVLADEIEGLDKTIHLLSKLTEQKMNFLNEEEIYHLYMARHVIAIGAYELATSPLHIQKIKDIGKEDIAVIETELLMLKMTEEYLELYCMKKEK